MLIPKVYIFINRKKLLQLTLLTFLFAALAGCSILRMQPPASTATSVPVLHVTADEVAIAMQEDAFYAKYGQSTLLIDGTINSISQQDNHPLVEFKTVETIKVFCELDSQAAALQAGTAITVQVANPQQNTSRGISPDDPTLPAVMLKHCQVMGN